MTHSVSASHPHDDFVVLSSKELPTQGELETQERTQRVYTIAKLLVPLTTAIAVKVWGSTPITVGTYVVSTAATEVYRRYVV